jgi:hypothetical protein
MIAWGVCCLVEPRGFEPLTPGLQMCVTAPRQRSDLAGRVSAVDRC